MAEVVGRLSRGAPKPALAPDQAILLWPATLSNRFATCSEVVVWSEVVVFEPPKDSLNSRCSNLSMMMKCESGSGIAREPDIFSRISGCLKLTEKDLNRLQAVCVVWRSGLNS